MAERINFSAGVRLEEVQRTLNTCKNTLSNLLKGDLREEQKSLAQSLFGQIATLETEREIGSLQTQVAALSTSDVPNQPHQVAQEINSLLEQMDTFKQTHTLPREEWRRFSEMENTIHTTARRVSIESLFPKNGAPYGR